MSPILSIRGLSKVYAPTKTRSEGLVALQGIDLDIRKGEIFALLGPNGAGKTTLINIVCGIVTPSSGSVHVDGRDIASEYRAVRAAIGLVPQELHTDAFETVGSTVRFSRGLYGRPPDPAVLERVLRSLSLWEKRRDEIRALSGGMKRRVMIAKALAHEPQLLFLDEPTAGVDVELRRDMWALVRKLREGGVTVILTTHYIEEAEEMADRIGVIRSGQLILVEDKRELMKKLGTKELIVQLRTPLLALPPALTGWSLSLATGGSELVCRFSSDADAAGIPEFLGRLAELGIAYRDLTTRQSSLEDIFVSLVSERPAGRP
jgi:ABC-2 type transport system ATP-binding protein